MEEKLSLISIEGFIKNCDAVPTTIDDTIYIAVDNDYGQLFYVPFEMLNDFVELCLHNMRSPFILVTVSTVQETIDFSKYQKLLDDKKLIMWFSQNVTLKHHKLKPIPIGIDCHSPFDQETKLLKLKRTLKPLEKTLPKVSEFKGSDMNENMFVLCQNKDGLDTFQIWETLSLGRVPIIKRGFNSDIYENLPVCFVDKWKDINENWLKNHHKKILETKYNYDKLTLEYWVKKMRDEKIPDFWIEYMNQFKPTESIQPNFDKLAVIIEPRKHILLRPVIYNFMNILAPHGWGLLIFHSSKNLDDIENLKKDYPHMLSEMVPDKFTVKDYCRILTTQSFWESLPCENILIFQTDCLLVKYFEPSYFRYGCIGAPWKNQIENEETMYLGNGGFSLRRKSAMIDIFNENPPIDEIDEDGYAFRKLKEMGYELPSLIEASNFSSETLFNMNSCGFHNIYAHQNHNLLKLYLKSLPKNF